MRQFSRIILVLFWSVSAICAQATTVSSSVGAGWATEIRRSCCLDNWNYLVGRYTQNSFGFNSPEVFINYFVFDLSGLEKTVVSATLSLDVPSHAYASYFSQEPSEIFELFSYESDIGLLMDVYSGNSFYGQLGSGISYGSISVSAADNGTVVEITLNNSAVNAINSSEGLFAFSGALSSLSVGTEDVYMFGGTGPVTPELVLKTIPLPAGIWLFCSALLAMLSLKRW